MAIEIESIAVAQSLEKFHHFLYASHFILETDQKPLEAILSKNLNQATSRLQRILIRTFSYHFTVHCHKSPCQFLSRLGGQKDTITLLLCKAIAVLVSYSYMSRVYLHLISISHITYTYSAHVQVH